MWTVLTVGLYFWIRFILTIISALHVDLLAKEIEDIDEETHLDIQVRYYYSLICRAQNSREDELLLASLMKIHSDKCENQNCPCGNRNNLYDPKSL